jgi:hypothetical protein
VSPNEEGNSHTLRPRTKKIAQRSAPGSGSSNTFTTNFVGKKDSNKFFRGGKMQKLINFRSVTRAFVLASVRLLSLVIFRGVAQEKMKAEEYQAQAMGQGTQLGQTFNVTLHIEEYSTPEERQVLVDAFNKSGSQGLYNALNKMKSKGHIAITGTLGYDVSFARKLPGTDGTTKIRVLTNRPISFGEAWTDSRSMDYNLSVLELDLVSQKNKSGGVLLPASEFIIDKKTHELTIENYQNPWKLVDVLVR